MARYTIRRSCGHEDEVQIYGPNTRGQREWRARKLGEQPCDACRQAAHDTVNQRAAEMADTAGWPALTGTERQVPWAQTIRADQIAAAVDDINGNPRITDAVRGDVIKLITEILLRQTSAAWWLDNRRLRGVELARKVATDADRRQLAALREVAAGRTQPVDDAEPADRQEPPAQEPETPPSTTQAAIGALRAAGWTVAKLAAELGVHRSTVYRWQSGQRRPSARNAAALALLATR